MARLGKHSQYLLAASLLLVTASASASAESINACDFAVGTQVSPLLSQATVHALQRTEVGGPISKTAALVTESGYGIPFSSCNRSLTPTNSASNYFLNFLFPEDGPHDGAFSVLQFDFSAPVRSFSYVAYNSNGDGIVALYLDAFGNLLGYADAQPAQYYDGQCDGSEDFCWRRSGQLDFGERSKVRTILLGATPSASTGLFQEVSIVPEPPAALLTGVALVGLFARWRRKRSIFLCRLTFKE